MIVREKFTNMNDPESGVSPPDQEKTTKPADVTNVVQGTAENLLNRLEENVAGNKANFAEIPAEDLLTSGKPGPLDPAGKNVEDVLNIISQSIFREGEGHVLLKLCDRASLLSVVSHSLSAYISTLESVPLQRLSARIAAEVSLWTCGLFRFDGGSAFCHDDTREGLVKITRLALHSHYPKMSTDGYEALFSRPPVIYLTSNTYVDMAHNVCLQLGLPTSSVRVLKSDQDPHDVIESTISEDKAAGRLPILCIANVHSSLFQTMGPTRFQEAWKKHNVWVHLEGHALAALTLLNEEKQSVQFADSLSLTIGSWIGVPAVPYVTLFKIEGYEDIASWTGLSTVNASVRLNCLPLWCVLRSLGSDQFKNRIGNIFEMMEVLSAKVEEFACLRVLSQRPENKGFVTVEELSKANFDLDKAFSTVSPALAFQYVSERAPADASARVSDYFNNLNSWLGQTMMRDCPQIPLEMVDVETTGYVLRLCPFESLAFSGASLTEDDVEAFTIGIENQTSILNATVCQREKFISSISSGDKLEYVEIPNWAGLGGVCYIPTELRGDEEEKPSSPREYTAKEVQIINHRNIQLVNKLKSFDSAFSLGEGSEVGEGDPRMCVRFGMVSMETDVEELLDLVVKTGIDVDDQVSKLQTMSELVRNGIEQAQIDLRQETVDVIWQEGLLRHVPIVGSIYNWISPVQKSQIVGRTLSLNEGKLQTTENIFGRNNTKEKSVDDTTGEKVPLKEMADEKEVEEPGTEVEGS